MYEINRGTQAATGQPTVIHESKKKVVKHDIGPTVNNYVAASAVGAGAGAGAAYLLTPNPVKKFLPKSLSQTLEKAIPAIQNMITFLPQQAKERIQKASPQATKTMEKVLDLGEEEIKAIGKEVEPLNPAYQQIRNVLAKSGNLLKIKAAAKFAPLGALAGIGLTGIYKSIKGDKE
jgi:hypothetical protein